MTQHLTTKGKKALGYIRISSERQVNGESPETQKAAIQAYASSHDMEVVHWFYDEAKSGKNTDRPELQNMLTYARKHKGEIDHVIVYKMSRASRDIITYATGFYMPLQQLGISIRSATEPIDETSTGQFMGGMGVLVAQLDNANKREMTVDNMTSLAHQGYWQHPPVLGYNIHKTKNDIGKVRTTLKPNNKAHLVKEVLERFSQGDITKAELARYAASIGLRSRYGKVLKPEGIHQLLKKAVYAGYVSDGFTGYELVEGKHEPLISLETYNMNQRLLNGNKKRTGEKRLRFNPDYPLKGLIVCPHCMKPLYASAPKTGAGGKSPRYHCSRTSCKGLYKSIGSEMMHNDFRELLKRVKPDKRALALYRGILVMEAENQLGTLNSKVGRLRSKLDTVAEQRLTAIKRFNVGELTLEEKNTLIASLDTDKEVLEEELRQLEKQQLIRERDIDLVVSVMEDVDIQWELASPASKQRFQNMLFPDGLIYDYENRRFGTTQISPLYSVVSNKKGSEEPSKPFLVAGAGFEPATSWL